MFIDLVACTATGKCACMWFIIMNKQIDIYQEQVFTLINIYNELLKVALLAILSRLIFDFSMGKI